MGNMSSKWLWTWTLSWDHSQGWQEDCSRGLAFSASQHVWIPGFSTFPSWNKEDFGLDDSPLQGVSCWPNLMLCVTAAWEFDHLQLSACFAVPLLQYVFQQTTPTISWKAFTTTFWRHCEHRQFGLYGCACLWLRWGTFCNRYYGLRVGGGSG